MKPSRKAMKFTVTSTKTSPKSLDCLVLAVYLDSEIKVESNLVDNEQLKQIQQCISDGDFIAELGHSQLLKTTNNDGFQRVLLVGAGKQDKLDSANFRKMVHSAFSALKNTKLNNCSVLFNDFSHINSSIESLLRDAIFEINALAYSFESFQSKKTEPWALENINFICGGDESQIDAYEQSLCQTIAMTIGMDSTKDLANTPCNVCTPSYVADQAQELAQQYSSLTTNVIDEAELEKMGFGAFCAVSRGSEESGKLVLIEYKGAAKDVAPYALVGKGITFDTGGLSLKPPMNMLEMKYDMTGAASVFGVMHAIAELNLPINVVAALACAENMPDGKATKPESVIKTLAGMTVEITNTDAEGRLVLCDTLTYVKREYKPKSMIDIATLTGAIIISLGRHRAGFFSNDNQLAAELNSAADETNDLIWQLPLDKAYAELLHSSCADMVNAALAREAGSITAGYFLSRFVEDTPWVHLDIAGVANQTGKNKAATGRSVALLIQYLINQAKKVG